MALPLFLKRPGPGLVESVATVADQRFDGGVEDFFADFFADFLVAMVPLQNVYDSLNPGPRVGDGGCWSVIGRLLRADS